MKNFLIAALLLCTQTGVFANPIEDLAKRIAPQFANHIVFEQNNANVDRFTLESKNDKLYIGGNNYNTMAVGLNHYLKYYCNTSISWYKNDAINLPTTMPSVAKKISVEARVKDRFFLNYCTFGYTMPWWRWKDSEHLIDWMALNGVNMPLAITGQEAIWYKVWKQFGLTDEQIRGYFTGPAFLPWHRMSNIDHWDGPLPKSWLDDQLALQKKIVKRERELGMKPILPAFAGHVPKVLETKYPNAKITDLGTWGGFSEEYYSHYLDPLDPLFTQIQQAFLKEQTKQFGTDHIYGADPFNEVKPPSWEPKYLASASDVIYTSMKSVDPQAEWLQMTWVFYYMRKEWTNERINAFVNAVPKDKMKLLDYYCENTEVWKLTDSFFGQPYIWCYLGNFGGNSMMVGNLQEVEKRMENALTKGGKNLTGIGSTLEGFDINPIMYDYIFEKAWSNGPTDVKTWTANWAARRIGKTNATAVSAWQSLVENVYTDPSKLGQGILLNAKPALKGTVHWTPNPKYGYSNAMLFTDWKKLMNIGNANASTSYDIAYMGTQVLGNYFMKLRDEFADAYAKKDIAAMQSKKAEMMALADDIDALLATQPTMLLGKWLEDAKSLGKNKAEKNYYEKDARMLITVWGGKRRSLNDYGNRSWAGLTKDFYKKRWEMFCDEIINCANTGKEFNAEDFKNTIWKFEDKWVASNNKFETKTIGETISVAKALASKYEQDITQ